MWIQIDVRSRSARHTVRGHTVARQTRHVKSRQSEAGCGRLPSTSGRVSLSTAPPNDLLSTRFTGAVWPGGSAATHWVEGTGAPLQLPGP